MTAPTVEAPAPTVTIERPEARTLVTTEDRCDRCGAEAWVRITLRSGGTLLMCAHHFSDHKDRLLEAASHVLDETGLLAAEETPKH